MSLGRSDRRYELTYRSVVSRQQVGAPTMSLLDCSDCRLRYVPYVREVIPSLDRNEEGSRSCIPHQSGQVCIPKVVVSSHS